MTTIDPHIIALALKHPRRLRCPDCGDRAIIEPSPSPRPGVRRVHVLGAYCDHLDQLVEIPPRGEPRTVEREPVNKGADVPYAKSIELPGSARLRKRCLVPGCRRTLHEGGFCEAHHVRWRIVGRPMDKHAWAAAFVQPVRRHRVRGVCRAEA